MTGPAATVIVPTTADRGALLPHSVGSVLAQTVADIEVFIVGDGADADTERVGHALQAADPRVRMFAHPKSDRRGERNRHRVLSEHARGRIVCYLCDRDLWLPDHIEEMGRLLEDADFGHTLRFQMRDGDRITAHNWLDLTDPRDRAGQEFELGVLPLSMGGHTLDMYRRLPHGWRCTPPGRGTDRYMWSQFLADSSCRVATSPRPTVLTFPRGGHPGWNTARRLQILARWSPKLDDPAALDRVRRDAWNAVLDDRADRARRLAHLQRPAIARALDRVLPDAIYRPMRLAFIRTRHRFRVARR